MKIPQIWAGVLACALATFASATTYYVSASGGDDSKDGVTTATAWKSIAKVNASTFAAGDQILFKRGEVWTEGLFGGRSGSDKKDAALSFVQAALSMTDALANRQIVDENKFKDGLGKVIDGTVECLNASLWAKNPK